MRALILTILITGCGQAGELATNSYRCSTEGDLCHEEITNPPTQTDTGTTPGQAGSPAAGIPGRDGRDGTDGAIGPAGSRGAEGPTGNDGATGTQGEAGVGCTAEGITNGAIVTCGDTQVVIYNGQDAPPTPYTVDHVIDPCGHQTTFDEVLLVMSNGQILAHFANGADQFLTLVPPGNYTTTDGSRCAFTINSDMSISNEHNY